MKYSLIAYEVNSFDPNDRWVIAKKTGSRRFTVFWTFVVYLWNYKKLQMSDITLKRIKNKLEMTAYLSGKTKIKRMFKDGEIKDMFQRIYLKKDYLKKLAQAGDDDTLRDIASHFGLSRREFQPVLLHAVNMKMEF